MFDPAVLLLFYQIIKNAVFLIEIPVYVLFAYGREKIKIKILDTALFELFLEYLLYFIHVRQIVAREFACKIKTLARIP